ncbi:RidA family protein [Achromobacter marplatensis]|nr:RidA family protein [Achromobacter marplatensis]EJO31859.1 endoribonuclease L-PSP [Achromobacter marplatensis]MDH2049315.1 RidA family protein [Achromobacter marplatensis]
MNKKKFALGLSTICLCLAMTPTIALAGSAPILKESLMNDRTPVTPALATTPPSASLHAVNPPGAGIPGVSQAVVVNSGQLMFLSGHVPMDESGSIISGGVEAQLDRVFHNMQATLRQGGAGFKDVVRVTIYVRDYRPEMLPALRRVRDKYIAGGTPAPASALIGVAALFHPDVLVEADAVAVVPPTVQAR